MNLDQVIAVRPHKTIYRDGDALIKVFDEDYSKSDILNEALNQARVEETGLAIPAVREVAKVDGKWAIVSDYIEGKTLSQMLKEDPSYTEPYLNLMVDVQMLIHSKRAPHLNKLVDKMHSKIDQTELDATTRYDLHTRLAAMPKHIKVLHGDLVPSNIIVTQTGKPYIIDWAHATQGNAAADAARSYLMFYLNGQEDYAETYLKLYCQKSDTARQYIQKWLPIVAASQSVKGNAEQKELLMRWVDVFDEQ